MIELVLDASVVLEWWRHDGKGQPSGARELRSAFEAGELGVVAPPLLFLEILNVCGRRWSWPEAALLDLADALQRARFDVEEPDLRSVAMWVSAGLSAYDASYVALAQSRAIELVTTDEKILAAAPSIARPPGS